MFNCLSVHIASSDGIKVEAVTFILFTVEPDKRNSSTDCLVPNGEFLEILTFSHRTGKKTFTFCISELENDAGSYHTILKVC